MLNTIEEYPPDLAGYETYLERKINPVAYAILTGFIDEPLPTNVDPTDRVITRLASIQNELDGLNLNTDNDRDSVGPHARRVAEGAVHIVHSVLQLPDLGHKWAQPHQTYGRIVLHDIGKIGEIFFRQVVQRPNYTLTPSEKSELMPLHAIDGAVLTHYIFSKLNLGSSVLVSCVAGLHHLATQGYPTKSIMSQRMNLRPEHLNFAYHLHSQYSGNNKNGFTIPKINHSLEISSNLEQMFIWAIIEALATNAVDVTDAIVSNRGYNTARTWFEGIDTSLEIISKYLPSVIVDGVRDYFYSFNDFASYHSRTSQV